MKPIAFYCTSTARGGLEKNLVQTAWELHIKNFGVLIITVEGSLILELAKSHFIKCIVIEKPKKYFDIFSAFNLYKIIKNFNIYHFVVFDNKDTDCASLIKLFTGNIKLYYHQNMHVGGAKKDLFHTLRYKRFDIWITPLKQLKKEVIELTNYPNDRIKVIPIGIETSVFFQINTKENIKLSMGIEPSKFVIGLIGRIDEQKGHLTALEAMAKINNDDFLLLIVGEPTLNEGQQYYNKMLEFIENNKLEDKVKIIGYIKNIQDIYYGLDLFLMTSFSETYGLVTIEAMLARVPIIASNSGGTIELTKNGRFAELFTPKDSDELASKIIKVYYDYNVYQANALIAEEYALENFTKNGERVALIKLFEEQENG